MRNLKKRIMSKSETGLRLWETLAKI